MRILVITNEMPFPMISGGRLRTYNLLKRIAKRHEITVAAHLHEPEEIGGIANLNGFLHGVVTGMMVRKHPLFHLPGLTRYAMKGWPLELKFRYCDELAKKIRLLLSQVDFDIVQIEESRLALYLEIIPPGYRAKRILTFYDVAFEQAARIYRIERGLIGKWRTFLYSREMRRWEGRYAGRFDQCITVSEEDRNLLKRKNPRVNVDVVPNGVDTKLYQPLEEEEGLPSLLFVGGMHYAPCVDAVIYFCREILPEIRRIIPEVEMWIVGKDPIAEVNKLRGNGVHITGRVEDVIPYYRRSRVCVVPLRAGGGTRLKVLEAMALGRAVVSTSIGCEGLNLADGEHLLIADNAREFAEKTVRLFRDRAMYQGIVKRAREMVVKQYDWDGISEKMLRIYEGLA